MWGNYYLCIRGECKAIAIECERRRPKREKDNSNTLIIEIRKYEYSCTTQVHYRPRVGTHRRRYGIYRHAQGELGEIVYVDVPTEGETVAAGEVFGSIEAVKTVADLLMPVEGEVVELNAALEDQPELVNNDPYGEGWIIKVKMADPAKVETLMDAAAYSSFLG